MELLGVLAGAAVKELVTRAVQSTLNPPQPVPPPPPPPLSNEIQAHAGSTEMIISPSQAAALESALADPRIARLLQAYVVAAIALDDADLKAADGSLGDAVQSILLSHVTRDTPEVMVAELGHMLWAQVKAYVGALLPSIEDESPIRFYLTVQGAGRLQGTMLSGDASPVPAYVRNLVAISGSVSRLERVRLFVTDIRDALRPGAAQFQMNHLQDSEVRVDQTHLYVERDLVGSEGVTVRTSELPIMGNGIGRSVVLGDPGVGKTTLVNHLVWRSLSDPSWNEAPIVVRCRDYSAGEQLDFVDWIASQVRAETMLESADSGSVRDTLSFGAAFVIFDGLDEIIDPASRAKMVSRIETFGRTFPLCSILVTARRIGYQRAQLGRSFSEFVLHEYGQTQVLEYVSKWFELKNEPGRVEPFMRDSHSLGDVRTNPLMLSLLCDLYRVRGYIPRNRVQIYAACADLLFYRWDSMRSVNQPPDHRQYGHELFQELAVFFQRSQSARAGVEEGQLVRIVAGFFEQSAGVEPLSARTRAQDFLNFCADRAWLLTSKGRNSSGHRIFSFTHRTFLEYYAAVAIVRRTESLEQIAREVQAAYFEDASSVLCDVLTQFAQENRANGGSLVLNHLLSDSLWRGRPVESKLALCLRVANSIPLPRYLMERLVSELQNHWSPENVESTRASSVAVFDLNRDAREYVVAYCMTESSIYARALLDGLISRWARLDLLNETRFADDGWADSIDSLLAKRLELHGARGLDETTGVFLAAIGRVPTKIPLKNAFIVRAFGQNVPGPLLDLICHPSFRIWPANVASQALDIASQFLSRTGNQPRRLLEPDTMLDVEAVIEQSYLRLSPDADLAHVAWLCCAAYELTGSAGQLVDMSESVVGRTFWNRLFARRDLSLANSQGDPPPANSVDPMEPSELAVSPFGAPQWLRSWMTGRMRLIDFTHAPHRRSV